MDFLIYIIASLAAVVIVLLIAKWVFKIETLIRYIRAQLFLQKRIAEKLECLNDEQRKWVEKQME